MTTVKDIYSFLCELAPIELQMDFDNAGFLVGHADAPVTKVITALDITADVVREAISEKAELIVSHHPVIWRAPKQLTDTRPGEEKLLTLIENRIAAICMHTNLDIAEGGVNDVLISLLGAEAEGSFDDAGCGRIGKMRVKTDFNDFLLLCKKQLNANGLRYYSAGKAVERLAVMGGAGADEIISAVNAGCDTYVTSDIKYHEFQLAQEYNINLIDADHFCTEDPIIGVITEKLSRSFPDVEFKKSKVHRQLVSFI